MRGSFAEAWPVHPVPLERRDRATQQSHLSACPDEKCAEPAGLAQQVIDIKVVFSPGQS